MEKFRFFLITIALAFNLGYAQKAFSAGPLILKYADPSKPGTARTQATEDTMKEIERRTGGKGQA